MHGMDLFLGIFFWLLDTFGCWGNVQECTVYYIGDVLLSIPSFACFALGTH